MYKKTGVAVLMALATLITPLVSRAQSWTNLSSGLDNAGEALAIDSSGNLYVGGEFTTAGGLAVNRVAKWDGTTWTNLAGERVGGNVYEMAFDSSGHLYAAGGNAIEKWNGTTWTYISTGMDWYVYALACDAYGNLYAGGSFSMVGGVQANYIAKWNGTAWSSLGSGMEYYVEALVCDASGNLYAGGSFTNAGGIAASGVAKWNGTTWTNLGSGIHLSPKNSVKALALDRSGNLYAGGMFSSAGDVDAYAVAKWNGTTWTNLSSGMDYAVNALAFDSSGNLYAGGVFNSAGGQAANRVAKWNGTAWSSLGSGLNNTPSTLVCDSSGNLYCSGYFSIAGGVAANNIAKWLPSYMPPTPVGPVIKANGQLDDVTILGSENLSITVQLDPGAYSGVEVDWWVIARAGSAWFYLDRATGWTQESNMLGWHPVLQGGLFNLPATEVLNMTGLPAGSYTFWFAVDYPMNGVLNLEGSMLVDAVNVTVQ